MDAIVKINRQKKISLLGRESFIRTMKSVLRDNKVVCVYGDPGVGKTHAVMKALEGESFVEVTPDGFKKLDTLSESTSHVLVDDIDTESYTWTQLLSHGKLSKGSTIYITNNIKNVTTFDCIHLKQLDTSHLIELARNKFPTVDPTDAIQRAKGNLKNLFSYLDGWDDKDLFMSPKDVVHDMICKSNLDVSDYLGRSVEEHGYSSGVIHENYLDARGIDALAVSENLSIADVYDDTAYQGKWELLPYFCHHGIVAPALAINHGLIRECVRPGSSWTKFNNFKMRNNKLKTILRRHTDLTMDKLRYIQIKCSTDPHGSVETLRYYNLVPSDIDVINHLGTTANIKPKTVRFLKNALGVQARR